MAQEITESGYESFRQLVKSADAAPSQWDYIELVDDTDTAVTRVSITGDSRASWSELDKDTSGSDETMEATITVTGGDADISTPVTIVESRLFDTSSGGNAKSVDTFTQATLDADSDELTVEHQAEVPQVA